MNHRTALYRVYFTIAPATYVVVIARNARTAIWHAKRGQRALSVFKLRPTPLEVCKLERLGRNGERQLKVPQF